MKCKKNYILKEKYFEQPYKTGFEKFCLTNRKVPWNSDQWACLSCPGIVADRIWGRLLVVSDTDSMSVIVSEHVWVI
jgi:hypothetical protein